MITILGIDPGSYVTGYGVLRVSGKSAEYVQCGVLKMPRGKPLNDRLLLLGDDLAEVWAEVRPDVLAIERAYLDKLKPQAALVLSEVRGLVKGFALGRGARVMEFAAVTGKRAATGRGNASKPDVRRDLMRRFGLARPPPLDATDALAVAVCGAAFASATSGPRAARTPRSSRRSPEGGQAC